MKSYTRRHAIMLTAFLWVPLLLLAITASLAAFGVFSSQNFKLRHYRYLLPIDLTRAGC
jgi:hypothetical protein